MPDPSLHFYSVIIPVFNSAKIVGKTVDRTVDFFEQSGWKHEIILINDGSADESWEVIAGKARANPRVTAIDLMRNYGQHTAIFCGMGRAQGDFIVTLDDDLQNPPEEIAPLAAKILEGYDVVFGRFRWKRHSRFRQTGSRLMRRLDRRMFGHPPELAVTNFRIIRREVVSQMLADQTPFPYITGLVLRFSRRRADVWVDHRPRRQGPSSYRLGAIVALVLRAFFSYSTLPGRLYKVVRSLPPFRIPEGGECYKIKNVISSTR